MTIAEARDAGPELRMLGFERCKAEVWLKLEKL
jgi:hypothetical protein